jgi:hypothetical protein
VAALDYWVSDWTSTPVYIRARGPKETNTRYAIIHQIRIPEYGDQYRQPMFGLEFPVMEGISVIIEHGQWQNVAPGDQECVAVSSAFEWDLATWEVSSTTPTGDVLCLFQTSTGRIIAGTNDVGRIYKTDDGATWTLLSSIGTAVNDFSENSGYLFAAVSGTSPNRGVYRSDDNGATWANLAGAGDRNYYGVHFSSLTSAVIASGDTWPNTIAFSGDLGVNWTTTSFSFGEVNTKIANNLSRDFMASTNRVLYRTSVSGWGSAFTIGGGGQFRSILVSSSGRLLVGGDSGDLYKSDDNGDSWALLSSVFTSIHSIIQTSNGDILIGDDGSIWRSVDDGNTWGITLPGTSFPSSDVFSIIESADGVIYAGENEQIDVFSSTTETLGSGSTCSNQVYSANKLQITNLTHVKVYDASATSFTDVYPMTAYPVELLPSTPANDDAVYFGIDTNLTDVDTGPFSSLVFDLSSPFVGWTTVAWEYWDGSAWSALTVADGTLSLLQTGVNSVHWVPPSDWATTAVDGVTGYWVRFRVDAIATSPEPPEQQNRNIYAVVNPYVEIAADQIGGDISALARVRIENVSDRDGPGGSAPDLYTNRVVMGLRSVDRGQLFTAYLNAADEQNPVGVTVTAGTDTAFADLVGAPTGRIAQWSPTGTGSWVTILTFSLATTIATQYYGTFRVFLRARQSGGTAGQMQLRLRTSTGSGGVSITTDAQVFANINDHQIIDFGQLTIPLSAYLKATELGDTLTLAIQGNTSSATPDANLYDLVLIPVDEWAADLTDGENSAASALSSGFYLDVDSVSFPKRQLRNAVKATGTNYTKAIWQQIANGPAILQANARQRLWLLSLRTASAGSSDWRSEPDVVHRVQMWSAERYRWARGSR